MTNQINGTWEDDHEDYGHPHSIPACLKCVDAKIGLSQEPGLSLTKDNLQEELDICKGNLQSVLDGIEELLRVASAARHEHNPLPKWEEQLERIVENLDG